MPGPPPKDPKLRQRRNKTTTAATLSIAPSSESEEKQKRKRPSLPKRSRDDRPWHPETLVFWKEVWASPMAAEFIDADVPGLLLLARLVDRFNYGEVALAAEIRLQRQCFGLTPLDRRRLQWEIERGESAERRRNPPKPASAPASGVRDPRRTLRAVK